MSSFVDILQYLIGGNLASTKESKRFKIPDLMIFIRCEEFVKLYCYLCKYSLNSLAIVVLSADGFVWYFSYLVGVIVLGESFIFSLF